MDHAGVLHATVANSRRTHAQDADTHSVIRTARSRLGTCVLQHAGARAFLPLTRTTLFMVSRKDGLHRRESTSQSTDLTLRGRETRHMSPHARLTHVVAHTSARTIVISNSELSSWHSHGATSLWYLPAAGAPDRVWNPSNECLGAHPAHQMPPPRCAPPRF